MAVARIFTRHPEAANALQEELRRQGYTVEVIVPDQPPVRGDSEIDLEFLRKAESPTYSDEMILEFAPDTAAVAAPREPLKLPVIDVPDLIGTPVETSQLGVGRVVMPALPPVALLEDPVIAEALVAESNAAEPLAEPAAVSGSPKLDVAWLGRVQDWMTSFAGLARHALESCRRQIHARMERVRDARHQRQLEAQAREVRAQERASELQAAREAAAARLQQLLRERAEAPPAKLAALLSDESSTEEAAPEFAATGFTEVLTPELDLKPEAEPVASAPVVAFPATRKFRLKPEYVFGGALAASALVVIGLALVSTRPESNLVARVEQPAVSSSGQPGGPAVKPGTGQEQRAARPSAARRSQSAKYSLVAMNKITTRHLGDDVTIRVYPQEMRRFMQARPAARVNAQPEFRRISDLQN
jgi:hypothetical protein